MESIAKVCCRCKRNKPCDEFYIRSGVKVPTEPGHYNSECKACMRERSHNAVAWPKTMPRAKTERLAIEALLRAGVSALPGKAISAADVDVVAWGCVWIEVKYARIQRLRVRDGFKFSATPKQMQRGYLAHLVMLICDYGNGRMTYHLFEADNPVFYIGGRIKSGFTFTPGAMTARKHGNTRVVMTQPMMDAAQNDWGLVERIRLQIGRQLVVGYPAIEPD